MTVAISPTFLKKLAADVIRGALPGAIPRIVIDVPPIQDFVDKTEQFFAEVPDELAFYADEAAKDATQYLAKYPPETEANQPPPPYYQRGTGMIYPDKTVFSSDRLGEKWRWEIEKTDDGAVLVIINEATNQVSGVGYASFVHGDREEQAPWHSATGWVPLIDVARAIIGQRGQKRADDLAELSQGMLAKADVQLKKKWDKELP